MTPVFRARRVREMPRMKKNVSSAGLDMCGQPVIISILKNGFERFEQFKRVKSKD
jgi:hypothetical protein